MKYAVFFLMLTVSLFSIDPSEEGCTDHLTEEEIRWLEEELNRYMVDNDNDDEFEELPSVADFHSPLLGDPDETTSTEELGSTDFEGMPTSE